METLNINVLRDRESRGLLKTKKHPTEDLWIWNYTRECQFLRLWDDVSLGCRGLITTGDGTVVSRPVSKFFNRFEEEGIRVDVGQSMVVQEKMDCYLGVSYFVDGVMYLASRGSFDSVFARRANQMLKEHPATSGLDPSLTYLFEIIIKEMPIVVRYDRSRLVLFAAVETHTGQEMPADRLSEFGFETPRIFPFTTWGELTASPDDPTFEGYVVRFSDGSRLKHKFKWYMELHSAATNLTTWDVWKALYSEGNLEKLLTVVPDEMDRMVRSEMERLVQEGAERVREFGGLIDDLPPECWKSKKDFAAAVMERLQGEWWSMAFSLYDDNRERFRQIVLKTLEPRGGIHISWTPPAE